MVSKGDRFDRWLVVKEADPVVYHYNGKVIRKRRVLCKCDCGEVKSVCPSQLKSGRTKSCGCLQKEVARSYGKQNVTHGSSKTPLYRIWNNIKDRCLNPNCHAYANYGGRGIRIYKKWENDFAAFKDYVETLPTYDKWLKSKQAGYKGKAMEIDRIDNDGHYAPNNLRFVTRRKNNKNRRDNLWVTIKENDSDWCAFRPGEYKLIDLYDWYLKHPNKLGELRFKDVDLEMTRLRISINGWNLYDSLFTARQKRADNLRGGLWSKARLSNKG
jgi:hypothetical protein